MRRVSYVLPVAVVFLGIFVIASVWADRVGVWAGLLAIVWLAAVALLVSDMATRKLPAARRANVRLVVIGTFAALLAGEVLLRLTATQLSTYTEQNRLPYRSHYVADPRPLHMYRPGQHIRQAKPEFVHERTTNSLGLVDREIPATRAPNEYRILALGDSHTEGVGASAEETWVRVMQAQVQEQHPDRLITAINAGVSGSDPYEQYAVFKSRLLSLQPDLVIVTMNISDLNEMLVRGGRERFQSDGTRRFRTPPAWEPVYALSYVFRLLMHSGLNYNRFLIPADRMVEEFQTAHNHMRAALLDIRQLCAEHGMRLLLVAHPSEFEIVRGSYGADFARVLRGFDGDADVRVADLLTDFTADRTITPENAREHFWPLDHHPNARGYDIMGRAVARYITDIQ